jgi:5-methylcytosine-specific restriction endonuclease McrA
MPRRPCLVCGTLASGSYCTRHAPKSGSRAWAGGSTRAWRNLRAQALQRDGRCVKCGARDQLAVHHVVPLAEGGALGLDGLTTLCEPCHRVAHGPADRSGSPR